jgi:hypothetical protein
MIGEGHGLAFGPGRIDFEVLRPLVHSSGNLTSNSISASCSLVRPWDSSKGCQRELLLDLYRISGAAVEGLRPEVLVIGCANELGRHSQTVTVATHRALEYMVDAQRFGDRWNILGRIPVGER